MCCLADDMFLRKIDFGGSTTSYTNKMMKGRRFRLLLDKHLVMEDGVEYQCKPAGGFDLLQIEMADDTIIVVQFY